jgi:hypothetical protein
MRALRISALVVFAAWVIVTGLAAAPAAALVSTYKGTFLCDDRGHIDPLAGMNVELWERGSPDWWPVEVVGHRVDQDFTDSAGNFSLTTEDNNDNYFVRMALRDAHGVHLRDFLGINDWSVDSEQKRNDVSVRDYGNLVFSTPGQSHKCAIWNGVHKANERFRAEIGTDPPSHGVELEADAVTAGVPFTPGTSILWPSGFPVGYAGGGDDSITRHEYGHVIRHGYDGDFGHFLGDVVTYNYLQNHETCNHTNGGFAFNEGWAEFWAEDFAPAPDCGRPGDMETEGDVAAALQELMENCAGGQRKVMIEVLQRNPGTIHSFDQFKSALGCPLPKLIPVTVIRAEIAPPPPPPEVSPAARAAIARHETAATSKLIRRLTKQLDLAEHRADNLPTCDKAPCKAVLKTATLPAVLRFEIDLARVQRGAAAAVDTAKEQRQLGSGSIANLVKFDAKQEAKNRKKAARAALSGVGAILAAARPILKLDKSAFAKRARRALLQAQARFRKATRKGTKTLPASLTLPPLGERFPNRTPRVPRQTPFSPPKALTKTITKLTLDECPAVVASPKAIEVAGSLTPALAGAQISVTFVPPKGSPSVVTTTVDAAGAWSAGFTPEPTDTGTWKVDAAYAGDSNHTASSAPTCAVDYQ